MIYISKLSDIPPDYTGLACWQNGDKVWYNQGEPHRTDGPAFEYKDGTKTWCINGKMHRVNGPAHIGHNQRYMEWWCFGQKIYTFTHSPNRDYIRIEDNLPSSYTWLGQKINQSKVLTMDGILYVPNFPGIGF